MKPILILLLLAVVSGSVWGQATWKKADPNAFIWDSTAYTNYTTWSNTGHRVLRADAMEYIRDLIRAEIEKYHTIEDTACEKAVFSPYDDSITALPRFTVPNKCQPEPLKMVIDTTWKYWDKVSGRWELIKSKYGNAKIFSIDTLYRLTPEQVEKLR